MSAASCGLLRIRKRVAQLLQNDLRQPRRRRSGRFLGAMQRQGNAKAGRSSSAILLRDPPPSPPRGFARGARGRRRMGRFTGSGICRRRPPERQKNAAQKLLAIILINRNTRPATNPVRPSSVPSAQAIGSRTGRAVRNGHKFGAPTKKIRDDLTRRRSGAPFRNINYL